jgi:hypothetical protein
MNQFWKVGITAAALLVLISSQAGAAAILFSASGTGADGAAISASALFDITGNTLTITLTNTALDDNTTGGVDAGKDVPGNTLTGVFFDLTGSPALTPVSATIAAGSIIGTCDIVPCGAGTTDVGGEFRYDTGSFPGGAGQGVASAGYIGGDGNFGLAVNLDSPPSGAVNGINFGLISNDPSFVPNGGLSEPLIRNQVVFVLTGVSGLTIADISNVSFQYGTGLGEPNLECCDDDRDVTEPGTLMALGWGLTALGLYTRRRSQRRR